MPTTFTSIDAVISRLEAIIELCKANDNPLGYFPALYHNVTVKVKEGIAAGFFEDGTRMEQLDIVFAQRYLDAYDAYQIESAITHSWGKAFILQTDYWPIVLQHLLMGINAHINLDLGIAAAEISRGGNIHDLKGDFDKINQILSGLVHSVQNNLSVIWHPLKMILRRTRKVDDLIVDFSMSVARDGAWKFATHLSSLPPADWPAQITARDQRVADKSHLILPTGRLLRLGFQLVRLGERGSVAKKIETLQKM
jgi:hypothetical protein